MWSAQEYLPLEILEDIMMHLDLKSLKTARQVCEYWKTVAEQRIEKSKYILLEGNIEIKKKTLKLEGSDSDVYQIIFVGNGLVIFQITQKDGSGSETIRVLDESSNMTWNVKLSSSIISGEGYLKVTATDKIVIIWRNRGSVGIWSRNGDHITTVERRKEKKENKDFKASDSCLLFLHKNSQFSSIEVKENQAVERVKYSNTFRGATISCLRDFCYPYVLVTTENKNLRAIEINPKKRKTYASSPEIQFEEDEYLHAAKVAAPFIICVSCKDSNGDYSYTDYFLRIFDFEGNKLLSIHHCEDTYNISPRGWVEGFSDLEIDIRMGSKTLFYRKGYCLVIMNIETLMDTLTEEGTEDCYYYKEDLIPKNSREINLVALKCDLSVYSSYFVETLSINFVESPKSITKLCFSQ